MRGTKEYITLLFKGVAMGAADVVPGVSGGTIAFIAGVYEELLNSIKSFNGTALRMLSRFDLKGLWRHINGNFLLALVGGILISVFSLARLMTWLFKNYEIPVWSFFFGLIIAATVLVAREIRKKWDVKTVVALMAGTVMAYLITTYRAETPDTWWFIILSGAIAICAMILPGISGSFILLLLGKYEFIIRAVSERNLVVIGLFAVGALAGIISFSHPLSWLLRRHHGLTVALMMGFMLGSLNGIWPWRTADKLTSILPQSYSEWSGQPARVGWAVLFMLLAIALVWAIEKVASKVTLKRDGR